jgi:protein TonB
MRTRTFLFSFLVHAAVIGAAMVARTLATTELPDPPRSSPFMIAAAAEVPEVRPPRPPRAASSPEPAASTATVPLREPDLLAPESLIVAADGAPSGADAILGAPGDIIGELGPAPPPSPLPPPRRVTPAAPLRVSSVLRAPQKIHHVAPAYPQIARAAGVSGVVILEALIAEDGSVRDVKVLRSVQLLDAAAIDAVRQWRFTPTLLNGVPVQVIMTVTVSFSLN